VSNAKFTQGNSFPNEMYVDLDVFHPPMVNRVAGHVDDLDIIAKGHHSTVDRAMELAQKLPKPNTLDRSISHHAIFCLCAGA
jgi:hypothetical protein